MSETRRKTTSTVATASAQNDLYLNRMKGRYAEVNMSGESAFGEGGLFAIRGDRRE